jgi:hypothetical protein
MPIIIMGGGLFDCFVCECEAVELALSLFSVDCSRDLTLSDFLSFLFGTHTNSVSSARSPPSFNSSSEVISLGF